MNFKENGEGIIGGFERGKGREKCWNSSTILKDHQTKPNQKTQDRLVMGWNARIHYLQGTQLNMLSRKDLLFSGTKNKSQWTVKVASSNHLCWASYITVR